VDTWGLLCGTYDRVERGYRHGGPKKGGGRKEWGKTPLIISTGEERSRDKRWGFSEKVKIKPSLKSVPAKVPKSDSAREERDYPGEKELGKERGKKRALHKGERGSEKEVATKHIGRQKIK